MRRDQAYDDATDLAYPPGQGGRVKMILLGILLPAALAWYAWRGFSTEMIWWPGRARGATLQGESARILALCYLAAAGVAHFRWFWGLIPSYRIFTWGTALSMLLWIGGCGTVIYREFFY